MKRATPSSPASFTTHGGGSNAYSSIKWYRRGCRLGSAGACDALGHLNEPVPPPANP